MNDGQVQLGVLTRHGHAVSEPVEVDIVREGTWVGVLSGRDSAARAGLPASSACLRGDGWSRLPMVRMTNVGLLPGDSSLEEMITATVTGSTGFSSPFAI